jgi:2-succinyl-5-enolpyruvyl-6-hydroxy-3-cyclohexene-1-carboxylate synthase
MSPRAIEWMTNPQSADLSGLATLWHMDHQRIRTVDDFDHVQPSEKTLLLEIVPDTAQTTAFWAAWDRMHG